MNIGFGSTGGNHFNNDPVPDGGGGELMEAYVKDGTLLFPQIGVGEDGSKRLRDFQGQYVGVLEKLLLGQGFTIKTPGFITVRRFYEPKYDIEASKFGPKIKPENLTMTTEKSLDDDDDVADLQAYFIEVLMDGKTFYVVYKIIDGQSLRYLTYNGKEFSLHDVENDGDGPVSIKYGSRGPRVITGSPLKINLDRLQTLGLEYSEV